MNIKKTPNLEKSPVLYIAHGFLELPRHVEGPHPPTAVYISPYEYSLLCISAQSALSLPQYLGRPEDNYCM